MSSLAPLMGPALGVGRAEEIAQRLAEAIHLGILTDGEQLPVEVELAKQFGVSPMTVREALAQLRRQSLVWTKRGRSGGTFVRRASGPPLDELLARLSQTSMAKLRDLADEHAAVSGHAAELGAVRASRVTVRRLFALTDSLAKAGNVSGRMRADCRFHIEVGIGAQSERLTRQEVALQGELAGLLWLPGSTDDLDRHVSEHQEIATAIASESPAVARELAQRHSYNNLRRLVSEHLRLLAANGAVEAEAT